VERKKMFGGRFVTRTERFKKRNFGERAKPRLEKNGGGVLRGSRTRNLSHPANGKVGALGKFVRRCRSHDEINDWFTAGQTVVGKERTGDQKL